MRGWSTRMCVCSWCKSGPAFRRMNAEPAVRWCWVLLLVLGGWLPVPGRAEEPVGVDLRGKIAVRATDPVFNRKTGYFETRLTLINRTKQRAFYGPFGVVLRAGGARFEFVHPDGESAQGSYVWVHPAGGGLKPGHRLKPVWLSYTGPRRAKSKPRYLVYGLTAPNRAPVADAGPDFKAAVGERIGLNGAASHDPDGQALRYRWQWLGKPDGSRAALANAQTPAPYFVPDLAGTYRAQLVVDDRIADSAPAAVAVAVQSMRPAARAAGPGSARLIGTAVALDGTASSGPPGASLSYHWRLDRPEGSRAALDDPAARAPRFTADLPGTYTAHLVVNDGVLDSREARVESTAVCASALPPAPVGGTRTQAGGKRPNFVVILADDLGYSDIGSFGGEIGTPNIDRLAQQGLRFNQFYNTARCWPTRSALLSGYYPQQIRMDPPSGPLPAWARLLPKHLKPLGYRSYHAGKWHIFGAPKVVADGGFDHSYQLLDTDRYFSPLTHTLDDKALPKVQAGSGYYATTAIADYGIRWLREHAAQTPDRPFFLYLAFTSPHFPLQALPEDIAAQKDRYTRGWDELRAERWERQRAAGLACGLPPPREPGLAPRYWNSQWQAVLGDGEVERALDWDGLTDIQREFQATKMTLHAAMVSRMDREVGRVLDQIEAMGAGDDTVVFFLSDNGADASILVRGDGHDPTAAPGSAASFLALGPGWSTMSNSPFRRHKVWVHEGGISTPLIVRWPAGIAEPGGVRHTLGHVVDLVPTLLELAGGKPLAPPADTVAPPMAGTSLAAALGRDVGVAHPYVYFSHEGNRALRLDHWKLVSAREDGGAWQLYDLDYDRSELNDLAAQYPDRVKQMADFWQARDAEFKAQANQ